MTDDTEPPLFEDTSIQPGQYPYRIRAQNEAGRLQPSNVATFTVTPKNAFDGRAESAVDVLDDGSTLEQNHPNLFTAKMPISYSLNTTGHIYLDLLDREVSVLSEWLQEGRPSYPHV